MVTSRVGKAVGGASDAGGETDNGTTLVEDTRQEVQILLDGNGKGGDRVLDDGGINQAVTEHSRTVHRYAITF